MNKGNVLVLGNSGVGKSTLINAVLGEERAETGFGITGTTKVTKLLEEGADKVDAKSLAAIVTELFQK